MNISLLKFIVTIAGIIFFFFGIDLYKRKKATILHFIVFFGGGILILFFIRNPILLNKFGSFFGLARGADLIVYLSIISLAYFYIELLNNQIKDKQELTRFVSFLACDKSWEEYREYIKYFLLDKEQKTSKKDFLLHIRCYNEEKTIGNVIDNIINEGYYKILILNDGSTDNTLNIIKNKQKQYKDSLIIIVSHTINRGPGAINQTGFEFCRRYGDVLDIKWVVMFDADDQMTIKDMDIFNKNIQNKPDVKVWFGSRFMGVEAKSIPFLRKIVLNIGTIVSFLLYKNKVKDYHCGFRVVDLDILKQIKLTADGFHYANEFIEEINKLKVKVGEVPVHIQYTEYSLGKGQKTSNAFKMGLEMIYKKFFFR